MSTCCSAQKRPSAFASIPIVPASFPNNSKYIGVSPTSMSPYNGPPSMFVFDNSGVLSKVKPKIILIGASGAGKTTYLQRIQSPLAPPLTDVMTTIGVDFVRYDPPMEGATKLSWKDENGNRVPISCAIWDTAGQEKALSVTKNYYRNSNLIMGFISSEDRDSSTLSQMLETAMNESPHAYVVIYITKCDLSAASDGSFDMENDKIKLSIERARVLSDLVKSKRETAFIEWRLISAKLRDESSILNRALHHAIKQMLKRITEEERNKQSE
jgi:GTPase SAR1 family protein